MTTDLTMLVWSAVLCVVLALPYTLGMIGRVGLAKMAGNRHDVPEPEGWMARGKRAHYNMIENLAPFAALVLVAHVTGAASPTSALGAQLFFWGRVGHAVTYIAGIPWARTAAFAVSVVGMAMVLVAILAK
jgi:uncharacterized MAPEG superfamily protein